MDKDNERYKALAEQFGDDLARIMLSQEREREKKKSLSYQLENYDAGVILHERNLRQQDEHRKRTEGNDYHIKDFESAIDNDPLVMENKKEQEKNRQKEIDDEKFWNDLNNKARREHEVNESIRKTVSEETYQHYLENEKWKKFRAEHKD